MPIVNRLRLDPLEFVVAGDLDMHGFAITNLGGGGGSASWGSVTGTLSSQTDLQAELDAKADGTGTASGTNTGDQTSIVGITGTIAQFNTALSDGNFVVVDGALGTPTSGVATNLTGTAASLTAGNATLAATVTTNANLTGHVTSTGNAAVLGSFTIAQLSAAISDANISGTNTGDQTSIVGISGTLAEFNTALSDANFASGGGTVTGASSGTNTGDDATNAQYSGLAASKQDADAQLTSIAGLAYTGNTLKVVRVNAGETAFELATVAAGAAWGGITGTLSAQTDLQSALDAKQATLVSATNIKTINGSTVLGSGDLVVAGAAPAFTTAEVSLGAAPDAKRSGRFTITSSGLTIDKPVIIQQANGPYTSKGTRQDEAEMDQVTVTGKVLDATTIQCYWKSPHRTRGNFKFNYLVGA